tara:strand:+ start:69 stop:722 length:654 start_codon:yes stop_codon:yes gene_type:complete
MIFKNLIKRLKRLIISSSNYWKIRHFLEPTWIDSYNLKKTHQFYIEFVQKYSIKTIFDFGCATGKTLIDIKINFPEVVTYGVDINQKAIDQCILRFLEIDPTGKSFSFRNKLNKNYVLNFLLANNKEKIDLVIFDRVLYCLDNSQVIEILRKLAPLTGFIIIDDFDRDDSIDFIGYRHRDWTSLLSKFSFECLDNIPSIYSEVDKANARTMIFKSIN